MEVRWMFLMHSSRQTATLKVLLVEVPEGGDR